VSLWALFKWITGIYPANQGACQMRETLDFYGPPGSQGWGWLDTVSHIHELRSPMLVIHGLDDTLFLPSNAFDLEARYQEALASGDSLPELQFVYLERVNHFADVTEPQVYQPIADFFLAHTSPVIGK
jgi:hypothetical protein